MKYSAILLFLTLFLASCEQIQAQEFSLGVYPPVIQATTLPPTVIKPEISLSNKTASELVLGIELKPFRPSGKGDGSITYPSSKSLPEYLIFPKVKFIENEEEQKSITLGPKQTKNIKMQIDIDRDTPLSDYYFTVIFLTQNSDTEQKEDIQIPAGIGTNVILSIGQNRTKSIKVELFSSPKIISSGPIPFTILVKNSGENLITPSGNVEIQNMFGKAIEKVPILPEYVLADSSRFLVEENYSSRSASLKEFVDTLDNKNVLLINKHGLFGKYEAKINGHILEDANITFTSSLVFYVIPVPYIAAVAVCLIITIIIILRLKKKKKKIQ